MVLKKFKYKKVSSTNDIAMQKIRQGYKAGIIISDKQTRGRGCLLYTSDAADE